MNPLLTIWKLFWLVFGRVFLRFALGVAMLIAIVVLVVFSGCGPVPAAIYAPGDYDRTEHVAAVDRQRLPVVWVEPEDAKAVGSIHVWVTPIEGDAIAGHQRHWPPCGPVIRWEPGSPPTTAPHEIGHAFALEHVDDPENVMYPEVRGGEKLTLKQRWKAMLAALAIRQCGRAFDAVKHRLPGDESSSTLDDFARWLQQNANGQAGHTP